MHLQQRKHRIQNFSQHISLHHSLLKQFEPKIIIFTFLNKPIEKTSKTIKTTKKKLIVPKGPTCQK